jgi:hypothetical protein
MNRFERGKFDPAASSYSEILQAFPDDPVAKAMLRSLPRTFSPTCRQDSRMG